MSTMTQAHANDPYLELFLLSDMLNGKRDWCESAIVAVAD
jgi:hypothetical protein